MAGRGTFIAAIVVLTASGLALTQDARSTSFEVATIRASAPVPATRAAQRVLPSRIDFVNTSLQTVLLTAFRLDSFQVSAPEWLASQRYDIQAIYPAGAKPAQVPEMLRNLLVERFGLVTHYEPRQMAAYELLVGNGGIKMKEVEPVDELNKEFIAAGRRPTSDSTRDTPDGPVRDMVIPGEVGSRRVTTRSLYETRTTLNRTTLIDAVRISMPEFVSLLRVNLDRPVIDKTGLAGLYQFKVELDASEMAARVLRTVTGGVSAEPTGVSTFKAVEGLGLKLEERGSPVEVLVVDKIARTPSDN